MSKVFDFYTLIFCVLAVVVLFRLYSVLGCKTDRDRDRDNVKKKGTICKQGDVISFPERPVERVNVCDSGNSNDADPDADSSTSGTFLTWIFDSMSSIDRSFVPSFFIDGACVAYKTIVSSFGIGDKASLSSLLAPEIYEEFSRVIDDRKSRGDIVEYASIHIDQVEIIDGWLDGQKGFLTVRFVSDMSANKSSGLNEDSTELWRAVDLWTFSRDLSSNDPNWLLVSTESP